MTIIYIYKRRSETVLDLGPTLDICSKQIWRSKRRKKWLIQPGPFDPRQLRLELFGSHSQQNVFGPTLIDEHFSNAFSDNFLELPFFDELVSANNYSQISTIKINDFFFFFSLLFLKCFALAKSLWLYMK